MANPTYQDLMDAYNYAKQQGAFVDPRDPSRRQESTGQQLVNVASEGDVPRYEYQDVSVPAEYWQPTVSYGGKNYMFDPLQETPNQFYTATQWGPRQGSRWSGTTEDYTRDIVDQEGFRTEGGTKRNRGMREDALGVAKGLALPVGGAALYAAAPGLFSGITGAGGSGGGLGALEATAGGDFFGTAASQYAGGLPTAATGGGGVASLAPYVAPGAVVPGLAPNAGLTASQAAQAASTASKFFKDIPDWAKVAGGAAGGAALANALNKDGPTKDIPKAGFQGTINPNRYTFDPATGQFTEGPAAPASKEWSNTTTNYQPINAPEQARDQFEQSFRDAGIGARDSLAPTKKLAAGGGISGLRSNEYAAGGRYLSGPGDGMSDNIKANIDGQQEARLADGEFVLPADIVSHIGNGSSNAGAKKLHDMMARIRKARTGNHKQGKQIKPEKYLPA